MRVAIIITLIVIAIIFGVAFNHSNNPLPFIILLFYFVPWLVATKRHHRQKLAIGILNLVGGWTLIGWVVALVWASTADVEDGIVIQ